MGMMWYRRRGLMVTPHIENVTGSIASFNSDYNKILIKSLICNIEPIQEGSGDPSPDNVRPISGRTGLNVVRTGVNIAPLSGWTGHYGVVSGMDLNIPPNTTFTVSFKSSVDIGTNQSTIIFRFEDGTTSGWNSFSQGSVSMTKTYTKKITGLQYYSDAGGWQASANVTQTVTDFQIMFGSTATDYEPYKGSTYSVNWETEAGTVYGGTLDVVSGKLTVDRGYSKLSDLTSWGDNSNLTNGTMRTFIPNVLRVASDVVTTAIMDCRKSAAYGPLQPTSTSSFAISYDGKIVIPMNRAITVAEFLSEYGNHEVCYPLATPIEIQLTPQEVRTLLGENNIWCDSGDVSVNYWKWGK